MRALAAYTVLLAHIASYFLVEIWPTAHQNSPYLAYFGMAVFFVLSGFVITYNYETLFLTSRYSHALWKFFVARFARLYPLHLFFMVLFVPPGAPHLLSGLTLIQSWNNHYRYAFPPAWSISAEWFFYICFVFVIPFFSNPLSRNKAISLTIWGIALCYLYLLGFYINRTFLENIAAAAIKDPSNPQWWEWLEYYSPYTHICSFITGCLSAKLYMTLRPIPVSHIERKYAPMLLGSCVLIIITSLLFNCIYGQTGEHFWDFLSHNFLYSPFLAASMFIMARYGGRLNTLFSTRVAVWAGEISYSVYFVQHIIFPYLHGSLVENIILSIFYTTVVAYITYRLIELPARSCIRYMLTPK